MPHACIDGGLTFLCCCSLQRILPQGISGAKHAGTRHMPYCNQEDGVAVTLKHDHTCLTAAGLLGLKQPHGVTAAGPALGRTCTPRRVYYQFTSSWVKLRHGLQW